MGIPVSDPFGAAGDQSMPMLAWALDPIEAKKEFKRRLPRLSGSNGKLRLQAIRVIRHKPGRRCVVEYDVVVERPKTAPRSLTLIGKIRARRFGKESFRLLEEIWKAGFGDDSSDGVSVPEPVGVIARFHMWFQRKAPGDTATSLLGGNKGVALASRIGAAIHKLHQANVSTSRRHTIPDELGILHACLAKAGQLRPMWDQRLRRVFASCEHLGNNLTPADQCGIHRDFYPAQVLVNDNRIFLIDFDLYCIGDPALDIGNFLGHMTEQSFREAGSGNGMLQQEQALEESFVALAGSQYRSRIQAYKTLTLARHIYLSTQFAERQKFAEQMLQFCEQRLGL